MTPEQLRMYRALIGESKEKDFLMAPFGYPGSKKDSLDILLKEVPHKKGYIEVFGGSGSLLLARAPSRFEVFNDRNSGITNFYQCIAKHTDALMSRLDLTIYGRELWEDCHNTWYLETDPIEKAAKWYYNVHYSFTQLGRNFGRGLRANGSMAGKLHNKLPDFAKLQARLRKVLIENQEWYDILHDFDDSDHVFYLDPPYLDTPNGTYPHNLTVEDHKRMLRIIGNMRATVCVSGNSSPLYKLYDGQPFWTAKKSWTVRNRMKPMAQGVDSVRDRGTNDEVLWIKQ